jgi:hypothetical protein
MLGLFETTSGGQSVRIGAREQIDDLHQRSGRWSWVQGEHCRRSRRATGPGVFSGGISPANPLHTPGAAAPATSEPGKLASPLTR